MPTPGSSDRCRKCQAHVIVPDKSLRDTNAIPFGIPAHKLTGSKRSRGFYCPRCFTFLQPGYAAAKGKT